MSGWAVLAKNQPTPGGAAVTFPTPPTPDPGDGVNEVDNSKWTTEGTISSSSAPTNWTWRLPGEGTATASAGTLSGHNKIRFVSTAADYTSRPLLQWTIPVSIGDIITTSVTARAIDSSSTEHVVLNHVPFDDATILSGSGTVGTDPRPRIDDLSVDTVAHYTVQSNINGTLTFLWGLDRTGDVTLEAPMLDINNGLRAYVATDPVDEPDPPPATTLAALPWRGKFLGMPVACNGNNVYLLNSNSRLFGHLMYIPVTGTLRKIQFQLASNFNDQGIETSKSRYQGDNPHGYPAVFNLTAAIDRLNSSFAVSSANAWTTDYTYTNPNGASNNSRVIVSFNPNLAVTADDYLSLRHVNRDTASQTYCALNTIQNSLTIGLNASPPRRNDRFHGDYPYAVRDSITGTVNSMIFGVAYEIETAGGDVYTQGICHYDATNSYLGVVVGGSQRVRQSWTYSLYHRASSVVLAARWNTSSAPPDDLTMRITGSDIATTTVDIPSGTFNGIGTAPFDTPIISLGTTLTFSPSTTYTVELYSPSSTTSNGYRINSIKEYSTGVATSSLIDPLPAVSQAAIDLNSWGSTNGGMQRSTNGGSSWSSFFGSNLPWALVLNENVGATVEDLF